MFASCITWVQLHVNACNWMAAVCAAAPLALANQLPLPRLYSALVRSLRKLRYVRIRPLPLPSQNVNNCHFAHLAYCRAACVGIYVSLSYALSKS